MQKRVKKKLTRIFIFGGGLVLIIAIILLVRAYLSPHIASPSTSIMEAETKNTPTSTTTPNEVYKGSVTIVADSFSIKVPNGWTASVSHDPSFLAILFARPNQLTTLSYNPDNPPVIDQSGITLWSGLTEHFFVIIPTSRNQFNPSDHLEVSSESFTFDDGYVGQKFYVVKHAEEAKKWGGLQKDSEWQGRTYIHERNGKRIEAHLAVYPSSHIDVEFYEKVVRTITD